MDEAQFMDMPSLTEAEVAAALEHADFEELGELNGGAAEVVVGTEPKDAKPRSGAESPRGGGEVHEEGDSASSADDEGRMNEEEGEVYSGEAARPDAARAEEVFDDPTLLTLSKRDAKQLGKKLYKRWKKLSKKASRSGAEKSDRHRSEADGDRSHDKKKKSSKKESAKSPKASTSERKAAKREARKLAAAVADAGGAAAHDLGDPLAVYGPPASAFAPVADGRKGRIRKGDGKSGTAAGGKPATQRLTAEQRQAKCMADAQALIGAMRQARVADEQARAAQLPALQRFAVMHDVSIQCRRAYMHQALVAEGILNELAYWLFDPKRQELAPYDLRRLALELLLGFEVRGIFKNRSQNDNDDSENPDDRKRGSRKHGGARGEDDLQRYRGICREDLESTFLGKAVNFVRAHPEESQSNQVLATRLLQRLSHAFRVRRDDDDDPTPVIEVQWRCKGDPNVAPPFDPVSTASDRFQQQIAQPDPNDPLSYLRVPPRRYQKGYVTNLSHITLS